MNNVKLLRVNQVKNGVFDHHADHFLKLSALVLLLSFGLLAKDFIFCSQNDLFNVL